ncbi:cell wall-associated NlpC family hydrolase [Nocardiopsis sp. Huas11]|uniref:C40 family peptidase n=1 Tax=Nocardiopsis sp. Huas11 TaxID=2183912 RepID=UPI000EAF7838|nr:C40 family peptidase [Nocardiopsis sp. Huas11]RKS07404.1 cell wall-associated NlpC family hydrolase [Nocardiopsis sp. Huas11]
MRKQRECERTEACRPSGRGRQASPVGRSGPRAAAVVLAVVASLAAGAAPALAQPTAPAAAAAPAAAPSAAGAGQGERIHQSLSSSTVEKAIDAAESHAGKPYAWGGTGPNSFDCSGLVQASFREAGVRLPRIAQDQVNSGTRVSYSKAERGDLLYWTDNGGYAYHVAIYLGGGRMFDAPNSGGRVGERAVTRTNLAGAVRL